MPILVRLKKTIADAILTVLKYVGDATGEEPTQEEIANAIKSYFIMNEIGNQIKFQRKKQNSPETPQTAEHESLWTFNLLTGPSKNSLARVGLFYQNVHDAITNVRRFVKDATGNEASAIEIAQSLRSTFIINEIKNQIEWQRNDQKQNKKAVSLTK